MIMMWLLLIPMVCLFLAVLSGSDADEALTRSEMKRHLALDEEEVRITLDNYARDEARS